MMQGDPAMLQELIKKVEKWLLRARWRHAIYAVWMVVKCRRKLAWRRENITRIQAYWRGALVRKRIRQVITGFRKVTQLKGRSGELVDVCKKIPSGSAKKKMEAEIKDYTKQILALSTEFKKITGTKNFDGLKNFGVLFNKLETLHNLEKTLMSDLASLNKVENERIKRMEAERKKKEEEELKRKQVKQVFTFLIGFLVGYAIIAICLYFERS
jgi:myosin-6